MNYLRLTTAAEMDVNGYIEKSKKLIEKINQFLSLPRKQGVNNFDFAICNFDEYKKLINIYSKWLSQSTIFSLN